MEDEFYDSDELFYGHPDWTRLVEEVLSGQFDSLDQLSQIRYLIGVLLAEVANGGMEQWYDGQGGLAVETVAALRSIGAYQTAEKLEVLNAHFPGSGPSIFDDERSVQLGQLIETSDSFGDGLDDLDVWLMGDLLSDDVGDADVDEDDLPKLFARFEEIVGR